MSDFTMQLTREQSLEAFAHQAMHNLGLADYSVETTSTGRQETGALTVKGVEDVSAVVDMLRSLRTTATQVRDVTAPAPVAAPRSPKPAVKSEKAKTKASPTPKPKAKTTKKSTARTTRGRKKA
jgi:outer membrane biosynthesis protein TonB